MKRKGAVPFRGQHAVVPAREVDDGWRLSKVPQKVLKLKRPKEEQGGGDSLFLEVRSHW